MDMTEDDSQNTGYLSLLGSISSNLVAIMAELKRANDIKLLDLETSLTGWDTCQKRKLKELMYGESRT